MRCGEALLGLPNSDEISQRRWVAAFPAGCCCGERSTTSDGRAANAQKGHSGWGNRHSCKKMFSRELCTRMPPLYSIKPMAQNRFMKKLTRERVVPIISARVKSWTIAFLFSICGGVQGLRNFSVTRG